VAAALFFPFFLAYLPFQVTSAAPFARVIAMSESLIDAPCHVACGNGNDDCHSDYLHTLRLKFRESPEQKLVDHLNPVASLLYVLAYIIYIIK